jgi:hypothetical protein
LAELSVAQIDLFRELGVKTPKYLKVISMIGEDNQEHHGILVERIHIFPLLQIFYIICSVIQ